MKIRENKQEDPLVKVFSVTVGAPDVEAEINRRLTNKAHTLTLSGFRSGKVPDAIMRQKFGEQLTRETVQKFIEQGAQTIISQNQFRLAGNPEIRLKSWKSQTDLMFDVALQILPRIEFRDQDFENLKFEKLEVEKTDQPLEQALQALARQHGVLEPLQEDGQASEGHVVDIDFEGTIDAEPFEGGRAKNQKLLLGENQFNLPGFEQKLIGTRKGDTVKITVLFPSDYLHRGLRNKKALFTVTVNTIHTLAPLPLDKTLAEAVGLGSFEELQQAAREEIDKGYAETAYQIVKRDVFDQLLGLYDFPVPSGLLKNEFEMIWKEVEKARITDQLDPADKNKTETQLRETYQKIALRRLKLGILVAEIGRAYGLAATVQEVETALRDQLQRFPGQEQKIREQYKNNDMARLELAAPIVEDKIVRFILEKAQTETRQVSLETFSELEYKAFSDLPSDAPLDGGQTPDDSGGSDGTKAAHKATQRAGPRKTGKKAAKPKPAQSD